MARLPRCCREVGKWMDPRLFKALCDVNRVAILVSLSDCCGPRTVTEIARNLPIDVSVVSRHLAALREAGVLAAEKRGREVYYHLRISALAAKLRALADALDACCPDDVIKEVTHV